MGGCLSHSAKRESAEIRRLVDAYGAHGQVRAEGLHRLCAKELSTQITTDVAATLVGKYSTLTGKAALGAADLYRLLLKEGVELFNVVSAPEFAEPHDLTKPLSHYFISASHNTYLKGGQFALLGGAPSVEMYVDVIQRGCRCVEMDCYSGEPPSTEPVIYHVSEALTGGQLLVKDVLVAIKKALPKGHLPMVLNVENHLSGASLKRFVALMKSTFGSKLLLPSEAPQSRADLDLPSPLALRDRVIVRCSTKGNADLESITALRTAKFKGARSGQQQVYQSVSLSAPKLGKLLSLNLDDDEAEDGEETPNPGGGAEQRKARTVRHTSGAKSATEAVHTLEYTRRYLTRVYPKSTAVLSENFDPMRAWELGCQLGALNWQTLGLARDLNDAMFKRNASKGYVLKPEWMLAQADVPAAAVPSATVHLTIIGAKPTADYKPGPYQEKLLDLFARASLHEPFQGPQGPPFKHTKYVRDNNSPVWDTAISLRAKYADMAFLRLELMDRDLLSSDDAIASFTGWLKGLSNGLRVFALRDVTGAHVYTVFARLRVELSHAGAVRVEKI